MNQPLTLGDFDLELQESKLLMMAKFRFMAFSMAYHENKVCKILVIMLDPCLKIMKNIRDFMGNVHVVKIVFEYVVKMVCPLLL